MPYNILRDGKLSSRNEVRMAQNMFFAKIQDGSHTCDLDMPFLGTAVRTTLVGCGAKGIEL